MRTPLETMSDMMEQHKLFYVEMLNRQEANFMSFIEMILEYTNTAIDKILKEVQEVKSSLQFSQAQTDDLREMEKKVSSFESRIQSQFINSESKDIISKMH